MNKKTYSKDSINKIIGTNIKFIRKKNKLSQERFAENIGVSTQFLSALERGLYGISLNTMLKICNTANCTPSDIFANISEPNSEYKNEFLENFERLSDKNQKLIIELMKSLN